MENILLWKIYYYGKYIVYVFHIYYGKNIIMENIYVIHIYYGKYICMEKYTAVYHGKIKIYVKFGNQFENQVERSKLPASVLPMTSQVIGA